MEESLIGKQATSVWIKMTQDLEKIEDKNEWKYNRRDSDAG